MPYWQSVFSGPGSAPIQSQKRTNMGLKHQPPTRIHACLQVVECDRRWRDFDPTADIHIRSCRECGKNVHRPRRVVQLRQDLPGYKIGKAPAEYFQFIRPAAGNVDCGRIGYRDQQHLRSVSFPGTTKLPGLRKGRILRFGCRPQVGFQTSGPGLGRIFCPARSPHLTDCAPAHQQINAAIPFA